MGENEITLRQFVELHMYKGYGWEDVKILASARYPQAHNIVDWRRFCFQLWRGLSKPKGKK